MKMPEKTRWIPGAWFPHKDTSTFFYLAAERGAYPAGPLLGPMVYSGQPNAIDAQWAERDRQQSAKVLSRLNVHEARMRNRARIK